MESEAALKWMLEAPDSTLKKLDSLNFNDLMLPGLLNIVSCVENWGTLSASFERSNYKNKAAIRQALYELNKKQSTLFKNPTISFFGVELTIDPWYYLGLPIILILLHDLTRIILYQKKN